MIYFMQCRYIDEVHGSSKNSIFIVYKGAQPLYKSRRVTCVFKNSFFEPPSNHFEKVKDFSERLYLMATILVRIMNSIENA